VGEEAIGALSATAQIVQPRRRFQGVEFSVVVSCTARITFSMRQRPPVASM